MELRTRIARRIARTVATAALLAGLGNAASAANIDYDFFNESNVNAIYLWVEPGENEFRGTIGNTGWTAGSSSAADSFSLAQWQASTNDNAAVLYGDRLVGNDNLFTVQVKLQGNTGGTSKTENASNIQPTVQFAMVNWVNNGGNYTYTIERSGVVDYQDAGAVWVDAGRPFAFQDRIAMPNGMTLDAVNPAPVPVPPAVFMMASGLAVLMFKRGLPRRLGAATA